MLLKFLLKVGGEAFHGWVYIEVTRQHQHFCAAPKKTYRKDFEL